MDRKEGSLEYFLTEVGSGSVVVHVTDWSTDHLWISRKECTPEFFKFIYRYPAWIGQFVFRWKDDHYSHINIMGGEIVKPDEDTLVIVCPQFLPLTDLLTMIEKVEESKIFMEKYNVD